jgi:hypothetical protein
LPDEEFRRLMEQGGGRPSRPSGSERTAIRLAQSDQVVEAIDRLRAPLGKLGLSYHDAVDQATIKAAEKEFQSALDNSFAAAPKRVGSRLDESGLIPTAIGSNRLESLKNSVGRRSRRG